MAIDAVLSEVSDGILTGSLPPYYPDGWTTVKLSDIARKLKAGGTPSRSTAAYWGGALPFVKIEDITASHGFISTTSECITEQGLKESSAWMVPAGSVLLSMYASIGEVAINRISVATNQAILAIVPDDSKVNAEYLLYALKLHGKRLASYNIQTTQKNVSKGIVEAFHIPLPPLPEQRAIAHVLRTVQDAIQTRRRELELERERKAALMQHLFTYGTRGEPTKQAEIGEMPESWQVARIGNVCHSSAFGPRFSADLYRTDGNVATLRTTDMDASGTIDYSTMPIAQLDLSRFRDHLLQPLDLLITRSGTCGIAGIFEGFGMPVLPGAFLIRFRLDHEKVNPFFVRDYINSPHGRTRISLLAVGAVQKNISGTRMLALSIPLPEPSEQVEIVEILRKLDNRLTAISREMVSLEELFRALLEELMTGRLSTLPLIEADDETAV